MRPPVVRAPGVLALAIALLGMAGATGGSTPRGTGWGYAAAERADVYAAGGRDDAERALRLLLRARSSTRPSVCPHRSARLRA